MTAELTCRVDRRRERVRDRGLNGIDDVEVASVDPATGEVTLCVHFLGEVPVDLTKANVRVSGGRRVRGIEVIDVHPHAAEGEDDDECLKVVLGRVGDGSTYSLCIVEPGEHGRPGEQPLKGFDLRYWCSDFTFTGDCALDLDCGLPQPCPPPRRDDPAIDYLAKDYAGFRRLVLDRLSLLVPEWRERHIPDIGITLVELLAYVGDQLSYYQDAVATEAYLETARQRISVRRHGRLVDYVLHEGTNARAFLVVEVGTDVELAPADVAFVTAYDSAPPVGGPPLPELTLPEQAVAGYRWFEPLVRDRDRPLRWLQAYNAIPIHTWGDRECCLPAGATSVWLRGDGLKLAPGDFLALEEVKGARTGMPGDADPEHRHVVQLTSVGERTRDLVAEDEGGAEVWVIEVHWAVEDALPFPLCVSAIGPAPKCHLVDGVSVARGNVVLVDEGRTVGEELPPVPGERIALECEGECQPVERTPERPKHRQALGHRDLTFAEPIRGDANAASDLLERDAHAAVPQLALRTGGSEGETVEWLPRMDLLASGPDDRHVVVEVDDDRTAWVRFGDDRSGEAPDPGTAFAASYRVGTGASGNVGAETIVYPVLRGDLTDDAVVRVRNPLPACGGSNPESLVEAKMRIPVCFRAVRERAVIADDYAEIAQRAGGAGVQRAAADLVWTGSWYEAQVTLDLLADADPDGERIAAVTAALERARRMGHDLRLDDAVEVPVDLQLTVCVLHDHLRAHVEAALADVFSERVLADGSLGYFHPDRWTFGQPVHVSDVVAAAQRVTGVESVEVTRLGTYGEGDRGELALGLLSTGRREVVVLRQVTADPAGRIDIVTRGGR